MKKLLLKISFVLAAFFFASSGFAQAYEEGKFIVSAGYGFPNWGKVFTKASIVNSSATNVSATGFGPLHFKFEYGLTDRFGLGLSVNYNNFGFTWTEPNNNYSYSGGPQTYNYTFKSSALAVNLRFNRHWEVNDKVDAYWGMGFGYSNTNWSETSNDPTYTKSTFTVPIPVSFETTIGMRYYFTENIGMYVEGGYAKSILQAGVVAKF